MLLFASLAAAAVITVQGKLLVLSFPSCPAFILPSGLWWATQFYRLFSSLALLGSAEVGEEGYLQGLWFLTR